MMAATKSLKTMSNVNKAAKIRSWTEQKTYLLLQVEINYKASKTVAGLEWETIKSRYEEIRNYREISGLVSLTTCCQMLNLVVLWPTRFSFGALAGNLAYNNTTSSFS